MGIVCYSERILNPFRGVMNVIALDDADAVTIDGEHWELYIHDCFDNPKNNPREFAHVKLPDIRFGDWSAKTGLTRAPILPSAHHDQIELIGEFLLEMLQLHAANVPFAFNDRYELWLLDKDTRVPLALLDSVCQRNEMYYPSSLNWTAGTRCHKEFRSDSHRDDRLTAAETLNKIVNARAGTRPGAQWFYRKQDGYGSALTSMNLEREYEKRELSPRLFPRLLIEQHWHQHTYSQLVDDFIQWLSPCLLLLDFLKDDQRELLESKARQQALQVARVHQLYPKIIDHRSINAARVEARLRATAQTKTEELLPITSRN